MISRRKEVLKSPVSHQPWTAAAAAPVSAPALLPYHLRNVPAMRACMHRNQGDGGSDQGKSDLGT